MKKWVDKYKFNTELQDIHILALENDSKNILMQKRKKCKQTMKILKRKGHCEKHEEKNTVNC